MALVSLASDLFVDIGYTLASILSFVYLQLNSVFIHSSLSLPKQSIFLFLLKSLRKHGNRSTYRHFTKILELEGINFIP